MQTKESLKYLEQRIFRLQRPLEIISQISFSIEEESYNISDVKFHVKNVSNSSEEPSPVTLDKPFEAVLFHGNPMLLKLAVVPSLHGIRLSGREREPYFLLSPFL